MGLYLSHCLTVTKQISFMSMILFFLAGNKTAKETRFMFTMCLGICELGGKGGKLSNLPHPTTTTTTTVHNTTVLPRMCALGEGKETETRVR